MRNQNAAASPAVSPQLRRSAPSRFYRWRYQVFEFDRKPVTWNARARQWHKNAGLFASIFMIWLGASGYVLNQSAGWGLDALRIDSAWLMNLYGLHPQPPSSGFISGPHWLAQTSEHTLINGMPLQEFVPSPLGLAQGGSAAEPLLFIAAGDRLVIATANAQRIDELRGYTLPISAIRRIGEVDQLGVAIQDLDTFVSRDGLSWEPLPLGSEVRWSKPERLSEERQQAALPWSKPTMPLEQILIDAHSGRLFGRFGPWVINAVGFAAVLLGFSGLYIFWSTSRRRRRRTG